MSIKPISTITLTLSLIPFSSQAIAEMTLTPAISLQHSLIQNTQAGIESDGSISKISPSLLLNYTQSRLDLLLNYGIDAIYVQGLDDEDRSNQN